jgi:hypothetical protein
MSKIGRGLLSLIVAGGVLGMFGCGKASEKASEKVTELALKHAGATGAKVDLSGKNVTIKTKDGEFSTGESVSIPETFPKDVFVDKSGKVQIAMKTEGGFMITMETTLSMDKAAETYSAGMKSQGWTPGNSMNMGEVRTETYEKDQRLTTVMISKSDKGSMVQVVVAEKK